MHSNSAINCKVTALLECIQLSHVQLHNYYYYYTVRCNQVEIRTANELKYFCWIQFVRNHKKLWQYQQVYSQQREYSNGIVAI